MSTMRVLIDHGAYENLGDLSMLEAAVEQVRQLKDVEISVKASPIQWPWPDIRIVDYHLPPPGASVNRVTKSKWLPELSRRMLWGAADAWRDVVYRRVASGGPVAARPIHSSSGEHRLGRWVEQFDALFVAGGGDLNDVFPQALWRCCALAHAFAEQGKPTLLSGQQLGPFQRSASIALLHSALRRASHVGLREPTASLQICREAGVKPERMSMTGDDSLGLAPADESEIMMALRSAGVEPGDFIAVNLRIAPYCPVGAGQLREVADLLDGLARKYGRPLLAVPISHGEEDSDLVTAVRLAELLGPGRLHILESESMSAALVKGVLARAWAAIGNSYHFCTFALCGGVPAIALYTGAYYRQKALGTAAFWGDARLAMSLAVFPGGAAADRISAVLEDEVLRQSLQHRAQESARAWEAGFKQGVLQAFGLQAPAGPGLPAPRLFPRYKPRARSPGSAAAIAGNCGPPGSPCARA